MCTSILQRRLGAEWPAHRGVLDRIVEVMAGFSRALPTMAAILDFYETESLLRVLDKADEIAALNPALGTQAIGRSAMAQVWLDGVETLLVEAMEACDRPASFINTVKFMLATTGALIDNLTLDEVTLASKVDEVETEVDPDWRVLAGLDAKHARFVSRLVSCDTMACEDICLMLSTL